MVILASDASAAWAAALGAVGASIVTGVITYQVTRRQVTAEDRRWYGNQEAARRAATADRLRGIYARMAEAAATLRAVIGERSFLWGNETLQERNDRHDRLVTTALNTVSAVGGQLLIEDSASGVRVTYEALVSVVREYFSAEANLPAGVDRADFIKALIESILALADKLLSECRQQLSDLERPIRIKELDGE